MKGYGQFCPIAKASEVLGERWTHLVVRELMVGSDTFNDLRKGIPLMSPSLLSSRLKSLEKTGIVIRSESNGRVKYRLSEAGHELKPIIMQLGVWGHRWVRTNYSKDDLDPSLLMWDIHRTIDTKFFKKNDRTVLTFEFTDYPNAMRFWWLVIKNDDVDVCLKDPGYNVDLTLSTDLKTMTKIWMGDTSMMKAMREKTFIMQGSTMLKKSIIIWLGSSFFADVKAAK